MMRLILKLFAVPFALAFTVAATLFSSMLALSDMVFGIVSGIVFLAAVLLLVTGQTMGGIAFIVLAFLISPAGLPALAGWFVKGLGCAGGTLRSFIFS